MTRARTSTKPAVLLVTRSDDNDSVGRVARAIEKRGHVPIRLDTDRYPHALPISTTIDDAGVVRRIGKHDLEDVAAVWYRRYNAGGGLPDAIDDGSGDGGLRTVCVDESRRTLWGTIAALPCPHVDTLEAVRNADHKELQLVRARSLGLDVPRTLFTNDPNAARAFYDDVTTGGGTGGGAGGGGGRVVAKMQSSFAIVRGGVENVVFTTNVDAHHFDDAGGLRFCPMMFQERIEKRLDVRATVVGDRVLAASLQTDLLDWRERGVELVGAWKPYTLPSSVAAALTALVHATGLRYGACDFVVDADGRHVFLEVNAGGEWFWLDDLLGIADAIADELTRGRTRSRASGRRQTPRRTSRR